MEDQQPVPLTPEQVSEACSEPCSDTAHFRMQQTMMRIRDPVASLDFYSRVLETMEGQQPVPLTPEQVSEACSEPCSDTAHFRMQQTMMRIRDPVASLDFYSRVLGMRLLKRLDFADMKFTLYFMGYESREDVPETEKDRTIFCFTRRGTIELTHNWGTESDPNFEGYCNGNTEPGKGFGHIGIEVPDVDAACKRFENLAVKFVKKPNDGKIKGIAFIQDPDGYWIEVLNAHTMCRF